MALLKLVTIVAAITLLWVAWKNRYRFVRRSPRGSARTKLSRNYTVQRDFLQKVSQAERMKLVALAYAACGFDAHYHIVHATARELSSHELGDIKIDLRRVFTAHHFAFDIGDARAINAHYQQMCSKLSADVEFLHIFLRHKLFFEQLLGKLACNDSYFAFRNPDIIPSEELLQLLWTENLERP